jgi:Transport and Golgi organisation 2
MTWFDRPDGGFEAFFNRDERRTRLPASAPVERIVGDTRFLAPQDGDFGGTWLAANEWGVVVALLNGAPGGPTDRAAEATSRGLLVYALAGSRSTADAIVRLDRTDLLPFRPFVLVLLDARRDRRIVTWGDGMRVCDPAADLAQPVVSSSFDSAEVARGRRARFHAVAAAASSGRRELHLAYHRDHVPSAGPRSVCMHREDAETVSFSRIEVGPDAVRFLYWPVSPCRASGEPAAATLDRRAATT